MLLQNQVASKMPSASKGRVDPTTTSSIEAESIGRAHRPPVKTEELLIESVSNTSYQSAASVIAVSDSITKLSWHNVEYSIPSKDKAGQMKTLLSQVNGEIHAGEVVAILGGSGAGKSTLLNILAGRIGPAGTVSGQVLVNGVPRRPSVWRNQCAYVEQDDLLFANLSVYETVKYAALLRLPRTMSDEIKLKRVDEVIMELGLNGCKNTWIGGPFFKGISGGERKRVSIAIELVSQPSILFLDEPTSGLDAFTAVNIIDIIKKLAVSQKKIVLMTIHQPRTDILEKFDKIALLSVGKLAFYGSLSNTLAFFSKLGFPLPPKTNPSDHFIDIVTLDQRSPELKEKSLERIKIFTDAWQTRVSQEKEGMEMVAQHPLMNLNVKTQWPSSWWYEFRILLERNMVDVFRDFPTVVFSNTQAVFLIVVLGFLYFQSGLDQAGLQNRIGFCFFLGVNFTFGYVMPQIAVFPVQKAIVKHERASGSYRASSAYLAKFISSLPFTYEPMLLLAIPIYWMVGLQNNAGKFFIYLLILFVHVNAANALGIGIASSVPTVTIGQIIAPLVIVLFLTFAGQLVNLATVPWVFRWIQYVSIIAYTNKALAQNEFESLTFSCNTGTQCVSSGQAVLDIFALNDISLWNCVIINTAIFFVLVILGFFGFQYTSRPLLRLF